MKIFFVLATVIYISVISSCSHRPEYPVPVTVSTCPADTTLIVSFSQQVRPVFLQHCALPGCHNSVTSAGRLVLDSALAYQSLQDAGSGFIDTADPSASLLYIKMTSSDKPMPPSGLLDSCAARLILKWIQQKALNN